MPLEPRQAEPARNVLRGILLVVRGRADGLGQFGASRQAVLAALAPMAVFLVVGAVLSVADEGLEGLSKVVAISICLLAPLVLSFEIARWLGRDQRWPRFAAAFCWCQWAAPLVLAGMLMLMAVLMASGMSGPLAGTVSLWAMVGYFLWLHWFLARHALGLSLWQAAGLVAAVNVVTFVLIELPLTADYLLNGSPPS